MSEQTVLGIVILIAGLGVGLGMVLVRPASGEPERLREIWPLAYYYRYKIVRLIVASVGFAFAVYGLALITSGGIFENAT